MTRAVFLLSAVFFTVSWLSVESAYLWGAHAVEDVTENRDAQGFAG